jgi:hypothetical protein
MMRLALISSLAKALGKGTLSPPLLFNLIIGVFSRLLVKAARGGYIAGFMNSLSPVGVISL